MSDQTPNPSINTLIDRERIRGASRVISEGADPKTVSAEQVAAVASDVQSFIKANKLSAKAVARSAGWSPGVVSDFLSGKYAGDRAKVAISLEDWLVSAEHHAIRPAATQFVWTNVAMRIKSTASYALDKRTISMIYGPETSGIGKTTALRAIAQELGPRRCSLATIDKVDATIAGLLKKLCAAVGVDSSKSNRTIYSRLVDKLKGRSHLLIIDQIHNLRGARDDKPYYVLADLWDATRETCGQLWCGTADLVDYLQRQQKRNVDDSLAQLRRRIFPRIDLMDGLKDGGNGAPLVTVEQIREMFEKNRLRITTAAARFMYELANTPDSGSIGLCVQIVEYATEVGINLTSIDMPVLKEVLKLGMTTARAETILSSVEETINRLARVG